MAIAGVTVLLVLNFSFKSTAVKVEEMYTPEHVEATEGMSECRLFNLFGLCLCDLGEINCLLARCGSGIICDDLIEVTN